MPGVRLIIITSFLFVSTLLHGQPIDYDSATVKTLLASVEENRKDTATVNHLVTLAQMYTAIYDSATVMRYAERARQLAADIQFNEGIIKSLVVMAFLHSVTGDWPNATLKINEARPYCTGPNEQYQISLNGMMFINSMTKNDHAAAKSWALKSLHHPLFNNLPDPFKWPTLMQLGYAYFWENNLDSAAYYANMIEDFSTKYNAPDLSDNTQYLLGDIARKRKNYDQALNYYRWHNPGHSRLASLYFELGKKDSALFYAVKALERAEKLTDTRIHLETLKLLADIHESSDPAKSNTYLKAFIKLRDDVFNTEKLRSLEEIRLNEQKKTFETEERETRFRNRLIQVALIALVLIFLISALLLYRNNKIRHMANQKLEKAYTDLKQTQAQLIQAEKMASLGELTAGIAHEIQNPLNFVNNFSELNTEMITEGKDAIKSKNWEDAEGILDTLAENNNKIHHHGKRADAIVKGMLQHSRTSSGTKELTDINKLADEYLRLAYHGFRAKDKTFNATIKTDFDETISKVNIIPQDMGRVLLNLINNALYAVDEKKKKLGDGYEPQVTVSTQLVSAQDNSSIRQSVNPIIISVRDNGNGIPEKIRNKIFQPFFTTKPTGEGTGLGLSLGYDIVKAHGGEIKVETKEGEGTMFMIQLPTNSII
jgi:two-component system NtrC family sensor kinase